MVTANKHLAVLTLALATTALASPSYARAPDYEISADRATAIHECSVLAEQYPEYLWGNTEIYQYRACMAEHGQQE